MTVFACRTAPVFNHLLCVAVVERQSVYNASVIFATLDKLSLSLKMVIDSRTSTILRQMHSIGCKPRLARAP